MSQPSADPAALVEAALAFAAMGWPVFPCSPETKAPLLRNDFVDGKKVPKTGGVKKASTDPDQIRAWWRKWPIALIGVATGHGRLFVVDFDPRRDEASGEEWTLDRLKAELEAQMGCALPSSLISITQSGGVHVWLTWPDDGGPAITNRGNLPLHVDVRGKDGYVIAPPSVMASGRDYHWLRRDGEELAPGRMAVAEAPAQLVAILRDRAPAKRGAGRATSSRDAGRPRGAPTVYRSLHETSDPVEAARRKWALASLETAVRELSGARPGERGEKLYRIGFRIGMLVGADVLSQGLAIAGLIEASSANGLVTTDGAELVRANAERAINDGAANPRDMSDVGVSAGQRRSGEGAGWAPFAPPDEDDTGMVAPDPRRGDDGSFQMEDEPADPSGGAGGGNGRIKAAPDPERDRRCAMLPQTDLGNAERFFVRHGRDFRFCPELGWYRWDRRRWALLSEEKDKLPGEVMQAVFMTVRAIVNEADAVAQSGFVRLPLVRMDRIKLKARLLADGILAVGEELDEIEGERPDEETGEMLPALDFLIRTKADGSVALFSDTIRAHARASEGKGRLEAIAGLVKSMSGILVRSDAFDVDREAINVLNGTIRIVNRGNEPAIGLFRHRREDLITKLADVIYDPAATCPDYDAFFERVQPDEADRRFLDQWAGLSATGDISHHKMAFHWGKGRNGKSTWTDQIAGILGDYSQTISFDTFLEQANKRKGSDATPDLARLPGVRFLRASEPEKGARLAEGLIKEVTGGEPITARHLNKGFFEFLPSFKFNAQGNYRPKISGTDDGIWGRVRLVPWTVRIPDREIDRALPGKLKKERSGIFNRMMAGLIDVKMNGLVESANVKEATRKYREASDQLGRFLRDCTADAEGKRTKSSELLALFNSWARATGGGEWQAQGFAKAMEDRGYERITSNGVWWQDIEITADLADIEAGRFGDDDVAPRPPERGGGDEASVRKGWGDEDDSDLDEVPFH